MLLRASNCARLPKPRGWLERGGDIQNLHYVRLQSAARTINPQMLVSSLLRLRTVYVK